MAGFFAINGRVDVDDAIVALGKLRDLDGGAVRDLSVEVPQQLFADNLRDDLPLRLIGGDVLREEERALLRKSGALVQKLLHTVLVSRRNRHDSGKVKLRGIGGDDRKKLLLVLHGVDLVDDEDRRRTTGADLRQKCFLLRADVCDRLDDQKHEIDVRDGLLHDADHIVAQLGARLMEARRVDENELRVPFRHDAADAVARGLRFIRDDGDLLPDEAVDQRGFADVRAAGDGYHNGFCTHFVSPR